MCLICRRWVYTSTGSLSYLDVGNKGHWLSNASLKSPPIWKEARAPLSTRCCLQNPADPGLAFIGAKMTVSS